MIFEKLTVCLDMAGCPNRCRHCWLGATPNGHMTASDLEETARAFRPFTRELEVFDWYREPDYTRDYKVLWEKTAALSDVKTPHFELVSYWRAVRDEAYIPWLKELGVEKCQLTLFGGEEKTDEYVGRSGAYGEIVKTIDLLLAHEIAPRLQVFVNQDNLADMPAVEELIESMKLEERCRAIGKPFEAFVHNGSCDGENEKLYDLRVLPEDLDKIPPKLADYTKAHFHTADLSAVFGLPESVLCEEWADMSTWNVVEKSPVFYVDKDGDIYPNITAPAPFWKLGNRQQDGVEAILTNYVENATPAQHTSITVPLQELVKEQGNPHSRRLFTKGDYRIYLLNRFCRAHFMETE